MKGNAEKSIRDFLMSRRAQIQPEFVGLPRGRRRRVSGLRREEVASLAGISAEYYTQIERGDVSRVSDDILEAISDAMQLNPTETTYLLALAQRTRRPAEHAPHSDPNEAVPSVLRNIVSRMPKMAVLALSGSLDIIDSNPLGRVLHSPAFEDQGGRPNLAEFLFENPRAQGLFPDWSLVANECVAMLRMETSRSPQSSRLQDVVDALASNSSTFAAWWRAHDVAQHYSGEKRFNHPQAGQMTLQFQALRALGMPDLTLYCYAPIPGDEKNELSFAALAELSHEKA